MDDLLKTKTLYTISPYRVLPLWVGMNKNMIEEEYKKELCINDDEKQKFVSIWVNEYPIHTINFNSIMITPTYIHLYNAHGEIITSFARADWDDVYYSNESKGLVMDAVPLIPEEGQ